MLLMHAPELEARRRAAQARIESLRWQTAAADFDPRTLARVQSSREELATAQAELSSIEEELARYAPRAPFDGTVQDMDPDLAEGEWVAEGEPLALLVGHGESLVETWLDEEAIKRVEIGDRAVWRADGGEGPLLHLRVSNVDRDSTRVLRNALVAARAGGTVLTREARGEAIPEQAVYRVTLQVASSTAELAGHSWRGQTVIFAEGEAPAARYLRAAAAVLVREAGW